MSWNIGSAQNSGWDIGSAQGAVAEQGIYITGTGITPFYLRINKFTPKTKLSLKWENVSDNAWVAVDRGTDADVYLSEITIIGTETKINQFITEIEANRSIGSNYVTLHNFNEVDDQIFGLDVDYSGSIDVTVIDYNKRPQRTLNSWEFTFTLQALSISYDGTPSLPTVTPEIGYSSYTDRTIEKKETYDNTFYYFDKVSDAGVFEGIFELLRENAQEFKRYLCSTIRGDDMTITISGVSYPLGPNRGTGAVSVKVLEFKEEQVNINRWRYSLKLAEAI